MLSYSMVKTCHRKPATPVCKNVPNRMSILFLSAQTTEFGEKGKIFQNANSMKAVGGLPWCLNLQHRSPEYSFAFDLSKNDFVLKLRKRISIFAKKDFILIKERLWSPRNMFLPFYEKQINLPHITCTGLVQRIRDYSRFTFSIFSSSWVLKSS